MEDDRVRVIAWNCINKFKETFQKDICNPNHKEVDNMQIKVNRIYVMFIIACLALVGNLIAYLVISPESSAGTGEILKAIQELNTIIRSTGP